MSWVSYSSLIPSNLFIVITVLGVLLARRRVRLGLEMATFGAVLLYPTSMPIVADSLICRRHTQRALRYAPRSHHCAFGRLPPQLGARRARYGGAADPRARRRSGERAAANRTADPGQRRRPEDADDSLAGMMSTVLQNDFHVPVRWREDRSANTYQNAAFSAEMLRRAGVPSGLLVTNPWHMARALWSFRAVGYPVVPAALHTGKAMTLSVSSFFPQVTALLGSYYALHELLGFGWYLYRYGDW